MQHPPEDPSNEQAEDSDDYVTVEWREYPFDDFQRHFEDVMNRRMEKAGDDDGAFIRNIIRLKKYFDEFYDEPHSIRNHGTFTLILTHIAEFKNEYDTERFGVADENRLWVSEGLLRAAHWYFASLPRSEWGSNEDALLRIKEWAREWTAENEE